MSGGLQQLWLSAVDPYTAAVTGNPGSVDWMTLFDDPSYWADVAAETSVFKISTQYVMAGSSDQLRTIFSFLNQHHIALALEGLMLPYGEAGLGRGIEGFDDPGTLTVAAKKIAALGGNLSYVAMDEPLYYGHQYSGGGAAQYSITEVAQEVAVSVNQIRHYFPNVEVGDIEPVPNTQDIQTWAEAYQAATGAPLAFFDADVDWNSDWQSTLDSVSTTLRQSGVGQIGVIINGDGTASSSWLWEQEALERLQTIESDQELAPQQIIIQTWNSVPTFLAPENVPGTLTNIAATALEDYPSQFSPVDDVTETSATASDPTGENVQSSANVLALNPQAAATQETASTQTGQAPLSTDLAQFGAGEAVSDQMISEAYENLLGTTPPGQSNSVWRELLATETISTVVDRYSKAISGETTFFFASILSRAPTSAELSAYSDAVKQGASVFWERDSIAESSESEERVQSVVKKQSGADDNGTIQGLQEWLANGLTFAQLGQAYNAVTSAGEQLQFIHASADDPAGRANTNFDIFSGGSFLPLRPQVDMGSLAGSPDPAMIRDGEKALSGRSQEYVFLEEPSGSVALHSFDPSADMIRLPSSVASNYEQLQLRSSHSATVIDFGNGSQITVPVPLGSLVSQNFSFY